MTDEPRPRRVPLANPLSRQIGPRFSARGPIVSAVVHLLVIAVLLWGAQKGADALAAGVGPGAGGGGGGGGNRMFTVMLPAPAQAAERAVPVAPPEPDRLVVPKVVQKLDTVPPATAAVTPAATATPATGPGQGAGAGPGTGTGTGGGNGSGTGSGTGSGIGPDSGGAGGRVFPPQPTFLAPPIFDHVPADLKGRQITVRFDVSERGDVVGIDVDPPIRDHDFRDRFLAVMRRYTFTPAMTRDRRAVRAVFPITFTL